MTTHLGRFAMVFPGQGSQFIGMLSELAKNFSDVSETFEQASSLLRYNLWSLVQEGPEEKLNTTAFTQPAMLVADIACYRVWKKVTNHTLTPSYLAGHSLGEYNALFAAEVFDFQTGVKLVKKRGELMSQAKDGAMAAVVGLKIEELRQFLQQNIHQAIATQQTFLFTRRHRTKFRKPLELLRVESRPALPCKIQSQAARQNRLQNSLRLRTQQ